MVNLDRLVNHLINLPLEPTPDPTCTVVCMNQERYCPSCIFHSGDMARWCPPAERQAKAEYDRSNMEVAA